MVLNSLILSAALLVAAGPAAPGDARRLVLATPDQAFGSALEAAFAPRGVAVVEAEQTLLKASDVLEGAQGEDAVVWLCDAPDGPALCLRRGSRTQVVRQVPMTGPLSPADAAALTMSVQVALLHPEAAVRVQTAPAPPPAPVAAGPHLFPLTFELTAGFRDGPVTSGRRFGLDVAYAPDWAGQLGVGAGISAGTERTFETLREPPPGPGRTPALTTSRGGDLTTRLFLRGRVPLGPLWLHLDAGPARHVVHSGPQSSPLAHRRSSWSADGAVGVVLPWTRLLVGARLGASLLLSDRSAELQPRERSWGVEGLLSAGLGFR